jgi:DNA-binding NtrC family response regulator
MPSSVLIVDDEPGMRELLKRWLTGEEYHALEARTAEEALEVASNNSDVKVALVDLDMPGRGGAWLVDQLRQSHPSVSVILATANDNVPGTLSLQSRVVGYLVKPLQQERLIALVDEGVRRSNRYEAAQRHTAETSTALSPERPLTPGRHGDTRAD